jgi:hypothetical protein
VEFASLDAAALEAAFLGAPARGTLLSKLIGKLRPASAPSWPEMEGTVKADALVLGPVTLHQATVSLLIAGQNVELSDLDGGVLGGQLHGSGALRWAQNDGEKPVYSFEAHLDGLNAAAVGQLLGMRWSGGAFNANGKIDLSGYTGKDLAASAKGTLHFEWRRGAAAGIGGAQAATASARFDEWSGDAGIANGAITLGQNQVIAGAHKRAIEAAVTLAEPLKVRLGAPEQPQPGKK